jgi:hypothetical protein
MYAHMHQLEIRAPGKGGKGGKGMVEGCISFALAASISLKMLDPSQQPLIAPES